MFVPSSSSVAGFDAQQTASCYEAVKDELSKSAQQNETSMIVIARSISWKKVEQWLEEIHSQDAQIVSWVEQWRRDIREMRRLDGEIKLAIDSFHHHPLDEKKSIIIETREKTVELFNKCIYNLRDIHETVKKKKDPRKKFIKEMFHSLQGLSLFLNDPKVAIDDDDKIVASIEAVNQQKLSNLSVNPLAVAFHLNRSQSGQLEVKPVNDQQRERSLSSASVDNAFEILYNVPSSPGSGHFSQEPFRNDSYGNIWANLVYKTIKAVLEEINRSTKSSNYPSL